MWRLLCVVLLIVASSCGKDEDGAGPRVPAAIVIVPNQPTVPQGLTVQLTGTVVDASGREIVGLRRVFTSADEMVATVTSDGLVTSQGPLAPVRITAGLNGLTNFVDLAVTQRLVAIEVMPNPIVLNITGSVQLQINVLDFAGTAVDPEPVLTYVSLNEMLATVTGGGLVSSPGTEKGSTTIQVSGGGLMLDVPITVTQIPKTLIVSPLNIVIPVGGDAQITAQLRDVLGMPIDEAMYAYVNGDPTLLSVSPAGLVTLLGPVGNTTVTVRSDTVEADVGVFVGGGPHGVIVGTTTLSERAYASAISPSGAVIVSQALKPGGFRGDLPSFDLDAFALSSGVLGAAIDPAGSTGYFAGSESVLTLDLATNAVGSPITGLTGQIFAVAVSPDGQHLFAGSGSYVYKIELATGTVVGSVWYNPSVHLVVHPTEPLLYASNTMTVVEINTETMELGRYFAPNSTPQALAVAADGSELYVANEGVSRVESYDLATGIQGTPFATVGGAFGLALSGDVLVATLSGVGKVDLFNRVTRERIATTTTGGIPRRPAINAAGTVIVVPNESYHVDFIQ